MKAIAATAAASISSCSCSCTMTARTPRMNTIKNGMLRVPRRRNNTSPSTNNNPHPSRTFLPAPRHKHKPSFNNTHQRSSHNLQWNNWRCQSLAGGSGGTLTSSLGVSFSTSSAEESTNSTNTPLQTSAPATMVHIPIRPQVLSSIRQLPEVEEALNLPPHRSEEALPLLTRASDVFEHMHLPGNAERQAVLTLLAQRQGLAGRHADAAATYRAISDELARCPQTVIVTLPLGAWQTVLLPLAEAKAEFHGGNFDASLKRCRDVTENVLRGRSNKMGESGPTAQKTMGLFEGCSLNGSAISMLLMRSSQQQEEGDALDDDDADRRDELILSTLREAADMLCDEYERCASAEKEKTVDSTDGAVGAIVKIGPTELGLAAGSVLGNLGVAEALLDREHDSENPFPTDHPSRKAWRKGISLLASLSPDNPHQAALAKSIRSRLHCNDAQLTVAGVDDGGRYTKEADEGGDLLRSASESAQTALKLYEEVIGDGPDRRHHRLYPAMGRALGLVATCYAAAGSAVTSEGLYQTAVDMLTTRDGVSSSVASAAAPLSTIDARDVLLRYADLCEDWEKREGDAERLRRRADEIWDEAGVPGGWRGASGIYGGLRFTHPGDFILGK